MRTGVRAAVAGAVATLGAAAALPAAADVPGALTGSSVQFSGCVESIGVGLAPTANVQRYVSPSFTLLGAGQPSTPFVARTAHCAGISVSGRTPSQGSIVQIGAIVVPPDGSGNINNYIVRYYTDDVKLAQSLRALGVPARAVDEMAYRYNLTSGDLMVAVPGETGQVLTITGTVRPSTQPSGSFTANWWHASSETTQKMQTLVPAIDNGTADLTLTTGPGGQLSDFFGATSAGFPLVQQFNTFNEAEMTTTVTGTR